MYMCVDVYAVFMWLFKYYCNISYVCCVLQLKEKNSRIEELDGEVLSVQEQLENVAFTLNVSGCAYNHACSESWILRDCVYFPVQGLSQEKGALATELSDLKEELIVAKQEEEKAMNERKIAEDFEYQLEIERTKLLREVQCTCIVMYVEWKWYVYHVYNVMYMYAWLYILFNAL